MASYLPQAEGLLPKWIGLVGAIALINGVTSYFSVRGAREAYDRTPAAQVSALTSRLWGTWTLTNGVIRLYAAYNLSDPTVYTLVFCSYAIAFAHFSLELLVFRSLGLNRATIPPFVIASGSMVWMWRQWGFYVG